jgi:hypothetical protein
MPDRNKPVPDQKTQKPLPKQPGNDPGHKPVRDTKDDPAPNPDGASGLPDTSSREEVERIRPNLKR